MELELQLVFVRIILRNNQMFDNDHNFVLSYNTFSQFFQDIDVSNTVNHKPIYYWIDKHNKTIPSGVGFVILGNCSGITVENLDIENSGSGIILYSTNNSIIKNNNLQNCGNAIEAKSCYNITVANNSIHNSVHSGVRVAEASLIKIEKNNIINSSFGIKLSGYNGNHVGYGGSKNVSILNNYFSGNNPAIDITFSTKTVISGNEFIHNNLCLRAVACSNNLIVGNNFSDNPKAPIYISGATNNTFYRNNFINNNYNWEQVSFLSFGVDENNWDNGSEGNYWHYWVYIHAEDTDENGIADFPYSINEQN